MKVEELYHRITELIGIVDDVTADAEHEATPLPHPQNFPFYPNRTDCLYKPKHRIAHCNQLIV